MDKLYKPNEFYDVTGVSRETLRYYVDKGLLHPVRITEKGYALYGDREVIQMILLRYYRSCNMAVERVREFLWGREMSDQIQALEQTIGELDMQIQSLERQRQSLSMRRKMIYESQQNLGQVFFQEETWDSSWMDIEETRRRPKGDEAIRAVVSRFPEIYVVLMGRITDFLARRPMPMRLTYAARREETEGLDPSLFHHRPAQAALVTRVRVKDPLLLQPQDLQPLYDAVERRGCTVKDGVYGHLLSMEQVGEKLYYYIIMRVYIER